jgi:predicted deacylase
MILNGAEEGPTLMLIAGEHGTELPGIRVIGKLMRELDPKKVKGQLIGVPSCNPFSLRFTSYITYQDDTNIARVTSSTDGVWGRPEGRETERLAYAYAKICMDHADYLINYHANPQLGKNGFPFTGGIDRAANYAKDEETAWLSYQMAQAFGITMMMPSPRPGDIGGVRAKAGEAMPEPKRLADFAMMKGIPCLGLEMTDARRIYPRGVEVGITGAKNVMKMLGMLDGKPEVPQKRDDIVIIDTPLVRTGNILPKHGGLVEILVDNFEFAKEGQTLAKIWSLFGELLEDVKIPHDGYVNGWIGQFHGHAAAVSTGDNLCYLCKVYDGPVPEKPKKLTRKLKYEF